MNKLYLIEGDNSYLIDKELNKITKGDNLDIIKYDLENTTIDDVIETLDTYDMFARLKVVICYNPLFYQNVVEDFNYDKFIKYLNNPSDNILVLVTNKMNNRLKVVKDTIKYFNYIKIDNLDINSFIKTNLEDYKMDNMTINYFIDRVGRDYNLISNELNKLKAYKLEEKNISKDDINLLCNKNFEESIFDLIEAILKKDKKKVIDLYNYFISNGTEVFQILVLLANQIRLMYNVKILSKMKDSDIANLLEVKEYPVKLARGKGISYSKKELLDILYNLGRIDEDIKNGTELPNIALISYILKM